MNMPRDFLDIEDSDTLLPKDITQRQRQKQNFRATWPWVKDWKLCGGHTKQKLITVPWQLQWLAAWLNFIAGIVLVVVLILQSYDLDKACLASANMYSPAFDEVDLSYREQVFSDLSLLATNIYREDPNPQVDAAWNDLGIGWENFTMSYDDGLRTGIQSGSVRVPVKYGGNFAVGIEVFHQLHCLNLLRKGSYYNYGYYVNDSQDEFSDSHDMLKLHSGHCLDTLRRNIMCVADVTVVPLVWVDRRPWMKPADERRVKLPNFHNTHKCRDFEAIRRWYKDNQDPQPWARTAQWSPGPGETVMKGEDYI